MSDNPFPKAIEILYRDGWTCGNWNTPTGETCLEGALAEALFDQRTLLIDSCPVKETPAWAQADRCVREAIGQVYGEPLPPKEALWSFNDLCRPRNAALNPALPWMGKGFTAVVDVLERAGKIWDGLA